MLTGPCTGAGCRSKTSKMAGTVGLVPRGPSVPCIHGMVWCVDSVDCGDILARMNVDVGCHVHPICSHLYNPANQLAITETLYFKFNSLRSF